MEILPVSSSNSTTVVLSALRRSVKHNKEEYQVLKDDTFVLEFDGSTTMRKAFLKVDGFVRYTLKLVDLDGIKPTENKYLIVGSQLELRLKEALGMCWLKKKQVGAWPIILTSANKVYLSCTSSVMILDDDEIPVIKALKNANKKPPIDSEEPLYAYYMSHQMKVTVKNLLIWARNRKNDVHAFLSRLERDRTSHRMGVKAVRRVYRLELDVSDDTAQVVVIMFDDTTIALVRCSSADDYVSLPPAILNLIGTTHVMEIKSHTYYEYGTFESFTCWQINLVKGSENKAKKEKSMDIEDSDTKASDDSAKGVRKKKADQPSDKKKRNRVEIKDSNEDVSYALAKESNKDRKKKRNDMHMRRQPQVRKLDAAVVAQHTVCVEFQA
ncbi:hypothetical protein Tco_0541110 [Tanacetum coccineum]